MTITDEKKNISWGGIKFYIKKYIILGKGLMQDPDTPLISKILLGIAIGYALMPFDLIPDFIPVLGQLDDLIIIPGLIYLALMFIPKDVYDRNKKNAFMEKGGL